MTAHLLDPTPTISPEQAKADRDYFMQRCAQPQYRRSSIGTGRRYTEDQKAEIGAEALYLMLDGLKHSQAARRLHVHPETLRGILGGHPTNRRRRR